MRNLLVILACVAAVAAGPAKKSTTPTTAPAKSAPATPAAKAPAAAPASTAGVKAPTSEQAGDILRVGGDYEVSSVDKVKDEGFKIVFKAVQPTGKYDTLTLLSDHVHVAVKTGMKLRLSAEILSEKGPAAEVSQVVLFFDHPQGHVPVWLLSNRAPKTDLRASKYLEMHVPTTDYVVM